MGRLHGMGRLDRSGAIQPYGGIQPYGAIRVRLAIRRYGATQPSGVTRRYGAIPEFPASNGGNGSDARKTCRRSLVSAEQFRTFRRGLVFPKTELLYPVIAERRWMAIMRLVSEAPGVLRLQRCGRGRARAGPFTMTDVGVDLCARRLIRPMGRYDLIFYPVAEPEASDPSFCGAIGSYKNRHP